MIISQRENEIEWLPEEAEIVSEAKGIDFEDIFGRETHQRLQREKPSGAMERRSFGEFIMDLTSDKVISTYFTAQVQQKQKDQTVLRERERER